MLKGVKEDQLEGFIMREDYVVQYMTIALFQNLSLGIACFNTERFCSVLSGSAQLMLTSCCQPP